MTYEIYRYIFIGGAISSGIMLVIAIVLFFVYKIPGVLGDLTGSTARKAIENIRNQSEQSDHKVHHTSKVNRERGRITDKITPSGRVVQAPTGAVYGSMVTEKIGTQKLDVNEAPYSAETAVLGSNNETAVLSSSNETAVLSRNDETTVLSNLEHSEEKTAQENIFAVEYEITFIHTAEVIS